MSSDNEINNGMTAQQLIALMGQHGYETENNGRTAARIDGGIYTVPLHDKYYVGDGSLMADFRHGLGKATFALNSKFNGEANPSSPASDSTAFVPTNNKINFTS